MDEAELANVRPISKVHKGCRGGGPVRSDIAALEASSLLQPPETWRPGVQLAETTDALAPQTARKTPA